MPDAASAPDVDAAPAPAALESAPPMTDATPTATLDAAAVPAWHATPTPAAIVEAGSAPPAVPPALAPAIVPTPEATRRIDEATRQSRRRTPGAATLARICNPDDARCAGRGRTSRRVEVCPERVPPMLQPIEVLRQVGVELRVGRSVAPRRCRRRHS